MSRANSVELAGYPASEFSAVLDKLWVKDLYWILVNSGIEPDPDMDVTMALGVEMEGKIKAKGDLDWYREEIQKARSQITKGMLEDKPELIERGKKVLEYIGIRKWEAYYTLRDGIFNTTLRAASQSTVGRRHFEAILQSMVKWNIALGINKQSRGGPQVGAGAGIIPNVETMNPP